MINVWIIDIVTSLNLYVTNIRKMGVKVIVYFISLNYTLYMSRVSLFDNQERKRGSLKKKSYIASKTSIIFKIIPRISD